jgi:serine O-acetyltransferase
MINNRQSLNYYLKEDKIALGIKSDFKSKLIQLVWPDSIYSFQRSLRKTEYYQNQISAKNYLLLIHFLFYKIRFRNLSFKLGFTIPLNAIGPGLSIAHYGSIVIHSNCKIGAHCRIHNNVNIGATKGKITAPNIGDNVYIAPGCVIFGDITIANNTVISANSVVNKSFLEPNALIGGVPAKILKYYEVDEFTHNSKE